MAKRSFNMWRILAITMIAIAVVLGIVWQQGLFPSSVAYRPSNSLEHFKVEIAWFPICLLWA